MGFRLRKTFKLNNGFRITLSKSGIGYSWGFPGYRITKTANGRNRSTYSIPGTGLGYIEEKSNNREKSKTAKPCQNHYAERFNDDLGISTKIESKINNSKILDKQYKYLLRRANTLIFFNSLLSFSLFCSVICLLLNENLRKVLTIICFSILLFKILLFFLLKIKIDYCIDEDIDNSFNNVKNSWKQLKRSKKLWQLVTMSNTNNSKRLGGVTNNYSRKKFKISIRKLPWYFKSDIKVPVLILNNMRLFFCPEVVLIIKPMHIYAIYQKNIKYDFYQRKFVEPLSVPKDCEFIKYQWLFVNKDGTPDKRYKNNKQFPLCKYEEVDITSDNGLNISLVISNIELAESLKNDLNDYFELIKKL